MKQKRKIAVAAWGNPIDPAIWSGTPYNIINSLKAAGADVCGLNCRPSRVRCLLKHAPHRLLGWDVGYTRRLLGSLECIRLARTLAADCAGIIHMGGITVSPRRAIPGISQYLLCDSTADYWRTQLTGQPQLTRRQREKYEHDERCAFSNIDHFFPVSQHIASNLKTAYGIDEKKITVIGTGRGKIAPLKGTKDYSQKRILMVAKQRFEDKGGLLLIGALQVAHLIDPGIHLTLVSPESFRHYLGGGAKGITLTGRVSWDVLQRLFDEACLYAMPALFEPWGLVYAEALATKTPILGLDRGALPEITQGGKFGFLVKEASDQAVAKALLEAVGNPGRLREMGESGQKYCLETFAWERTAGKIINTIFP